MTTTLDTIVMTTCNGGMDCRGHSVHPYTPDYHDSSSGSDCR